MHVAGGSTCARSHPHLSLPGWSCADRRNTAAAHVFQVERARATPLDLRGLAGGGLLGGRRLLNKN